MDLRVNVNVSRDSSAAGTCYDCGMPAYCYRIAKAVTSQIRRISFSRYLWESLIEFEIGRCTQIPVRSYSVRRPGSCRPTQPGNIRSPTFYLELGAPRLGC